MTARIKSEPRTFIIPTTYENSEWDRAQTPNPLRARLRHAATRE